MTEARMVVGDALTVLHAMPDASVDLVLTSPPFLALRSYLPADHPDKPLEGGSQATPGEFIDWLLDVTERCRRVLAPHGSLCVELGDTYSGSGGAGGDYGDQGMREGQPKFVGTNGRRNRPDDVAAGLLAPTKRPGPERRDSIDGWPLDKSLCLIPESYRWALAYGRNPFTGRETPRWRVRNVIRWCRPNPPVGALGDKFRPATSEIVVACTSRTRYFDLDGVREPSDYSRPNLSGKGARGPGLDPPGTKHNSSDHCVNPAGAPPLDWWEVSTEAYSGSHYAAWPRKLLVKPVVAMCPEKVCTVCGQPSRRIVRVDGYTDHNGVLHAEGEKWSSGMAAGRGAHADKPGSRTTTTTTTLGWSDCGHNAYRPGVVLDPFCGTGTTLAVATGHGRDAIGIDLDARNLHLARERVGMFLTHTEEVTT